MIISLLCYAINPFIAFFQTIIGLFCYAYGMNDKGFEVLKLMHLVVVVVWTMSDDMGSTGQIIRDVYLMNLITNHYGGYHLTILTLK